ncbi:MAG TPA: hypothetical protein VEH84_07380 [Alphaproteobacteria bacterium]|nr:hypothetical protein [Alphaproteobacteria bacterium]
MSGFEPPVWRKPDGSPLSCAEKIRVLNENLAELQQMAQDALEDALVMGADEAQIRAALRALIESLENPYGSTD